MSLAALNNQVVFKKLLSDEEVLKAFVKDLLGIDIQPQTIEVEKKFVSPTDTNGKRGNFSALSPQTLFPQSLLSL